MTNPKDIADTIRAKVIELNDLMVDAREAGLFVYIRAEGVWNGKGDKKAAVELPSAPLLEVHRIKQEVEL